MFSAHGWSDPSFFPFRKRVEVRVVSLSGAIYMSGKEKLDQEIPIPPEIEQWVNSVEMQYNLPTSEDQQELAATEIESEQDMVTDKRPPVENQIVGYNEAQDQYVLRSAGEARYVDSSELFQKLSNGEKVFVKVGKDSIPGFSITFQNNEDMFIKEDNAMFVEHITVDEFKKKLDTIHRSTELPSQLYSVHDNIRDIILKDLIREDEERMQTKDVRKDQNHVIDHFRFLKYWNMTNILKKFTLMLQKQFQIVSTKMNLHWLKH
jgi:hypothetical protein